MNNQKVAPCDLSHILMVGNGINTEKRLVWKDLLEKIQKNYKISQNEKANRKAPLDISKSSLSTLLLYDYISVDNESSVKKSLKKYCNEEYKADKDYVKQIWGVYDVVMTTNFDKNLHISKTDLYKNLSLKRKSNLARRVEFQFRKRKKKLYYIHGYFETKESINLGLTQYIDSIVSIYSRVKGKYFSDKNKNKAKTPDAWVDFFFTDNTTIDILGFGFWDSEIDLWWILEQRNKMIKDGNLKNNRIRYFDFTEKKEINDDRNILLETFNVVVKQQLIKEKKYKEAYQNTLVKLAEEYRSVLK